MTYIEGETGRINGAGEGELASTGFGVVVRLVSPVNSDQSYDLRLHHHVYFQDQDIFTVLNAAADIHAIAQGLTQTGTGETKFQHNAFGVSVLVPVGNNLDKYYQLGLDDSGSVRVSDGTQEYSLEVLGTPEERLAIATEIHDIGNIQHQLVPLDYLRARRAFSARSTIVYEADTSEPIN